MKTALPISILAAACLCSCSGSGSADGSQVDTLALSGSLLIPYESLKSPQKIIVSNDRLYVQNSSSVDTLLDEFDLNGSYIRSFLPKGQGPDEAHHVWAPYYSDADGGICFSKDPDKLLCIPAQASSAGQHISSIYDFDKEKIGDDSHRPGMEKWKLANGFVILGSDSPKGFFAVVGKDGRIEKFAVDNIPESEFGKDAPGWAKYNFTRPLGSPSPDGRHAAWIMSSADMLAFATAEEDSVRFVTLYNAPPKGIQYTINGDNCMFSYTPERTIYYSGSPAVSDSHVYAIYTGMLQDDMLDLSQKVKAGEASAPATQVRVFDFDGNLKKVLLLQNGGMYSSIAVSPDDKTLYQLTETPEDGYIIYKYDI